MGFIMNNIEQMLESTKGCFAIEGMPLDTEDIQRGRDILSGKKTIEECIAEIKAQFGLVSTKA